MSKQTARPSRSEFGTLGLLANLLLLGVLLTMFAPRSSKGRDQGGADAATGAAAVMTPSRRAVRYFANGLMGLGMLLLMGGAGAYGYSFIMEQSARSDPWLSQLEQVWSQEQATPAPIPTDVPASPAAVGGAESTPTATPASTPTVAPTASPRVSPPAVGIKIASIGVESRVIEVGIKEGEYEVPRFYVGHYGDTAHPGAGGNGVYSGHVESLSAGNVFARLPEIEKGAEVLLYSEEGIWRYRVSEIKQVRNDDLSVMADTDVEVVTMITCTGTFDPAEGQYTHRLVVVAEPSGTGGPVIPSTDAR